MKLRILATLVLTMLTLAAPATARVNEMNPRGGPTAETRTPPARQLTTPRQHGSRADSQRYAQREAAAKNAKKFRGGEAAVVITATAAIIILLGVVIILLIT